MGNGEKSIEDKLNALLSPKQWRRDVYKEFERIPRGFLASYGSIASRVENESGHNPGARNVAWLRRCLYAIYGHNTKFPLHRIARVGDEKSLFDSPETKLRNDEKRKAEKSFSNAQWW